MRLHGGGGMKFAARADYDRHLRLSALLEPRLPLQPKVWNFDLAHPGVPRSMDENDAHGCCVEAYQAKAERRFQLVQQGVLLDIPGATILADWRRKNGNTEDGLILLDSLKDWRETGWTLSDGHTYRNSAVAVIDTDATDRFEQAVSLFGHAPIGLLLPRWITQDIPASLRPGADGRTIWKLQHDADLDLEDPDGGHCVIVKGYVDVRGTADPGGVLIETWTEDVLMTWPFFWRYNLERYAVVDQRDTWVQHPGVDINALDALVPQIGQPA